jgi:hypothetical protein
MNMPYAKADSPDEIPTVGEFPKAGFFFSLSYNLSRLQSE